MMKNCRAHGCSSNDSTKIEGKDIVFFPFPEDDCQRQVWLKKCNIQSDNKEMPLYICQLHFDKTNLTSAMELKPDAEPTIFDTAEDVQRKRKLSDTFQSEPEKSSLTKQKKLVQDSNNVVTPPHSPLSQLKNTTETDIVQSKTDLRPENHPSVIGSDSKAESNKEAKLNKKIYRLSIQIDKICGKPCPRSKKLVMQAESNKEKEDCTINIDNIVQVEQTHVGFEKKMACAKGGCKLKKSVYDSKPAFQCELCDKYYVTKKGGQQEEKTNSCSLCNKSFPTPQLLYLHIKSHFICDMCQTECTSQASYDKHSRLHVSTDPLYPYKCHQCTDIFQSREDVRQHCMMVHPTIKLQNTILQVTASPLASSASQAKEYRCASCNITFRNEQAYKNHVNSHKKKEGLRCNLSDTNNIFPVPNPLTGSQIGILRAVKFSCRVCSKEFDNVGEVDKHTRTHLEDTEEEQKCNICKKVFTSNSQFAEHLKYHLSRAHPCPLCPKAFINRTTLNIHLKTHSES